MGANAHLDHSTTREPVHHHWPLLTAVAACVAIDVAAIWYVVERWEYVSPYLPWALIAIGVGSFFLRTRSLMRKED
jgi:hypothetical protein